MTTQKTQTQRVLETLQTGKTLTSAQARSRGIQRLSARIFELRQDNHNVLSVPYVNKQGMNAVKYALAPNVAKRSTRAV